MYGFPYGGGLSLIKQVPTVTDYTSYVEMILRKKRYGMMRRKRG